MRVSAVYGKATVAAAEPGIDAAAAVEPGIEAAVAVEPEAEVDASVVDVAFDQTIRMESSVAVELM